MERRTPRAHIDTHAVSSLRESRVEEVEVQLDGSDPAQRVPHGHGLPQGGQHLVPVGDAHATGLRADDHMTQVLAPAVLRGLGHRHSQGQFLRGRCYTASLTQERQCERDSASPQPLSFGGSTAACVDTPRKTNPQPAADTQHQTSGLIVSEAPRFSVEYLPRFMIFSLLKAEDVEKHIIHKSI